MELKERTAWAIVKFQDETGLTDPQAGKILGTNKNTIAAYRKCEGLIKGEVLGSLINNTSFSFSAVWLMTGEGEPFPGAREKYPEVCGPQAAHPGTPQEKDLSGDYSASPTQGISDDLVMAARILESPTPYATALHTNIVSFYHSINQQAKIEELEQKLNQIIKHNKGEPATMEMEGETDTPSESAIARKRSA